MKNFLKKICSCRLQQRALTVVFILFLCVLKESAGLALSPETLTYDVRYLRIFPVGQLVIAAQPYLLDKQDIYQVSGAYLHPTWFSFFFKPRGKINSYIDSRTLLPLRYEEFYSYPWHDDVNSVLIYDQEKKRVYIDRNGEKETKDIFDNTLDPISALYFLRRQSWHRGEIKNYNLNNHQSNYEMVIYCLGNARVDKQETWHLKGLFKKRDSERDVGSISFQAWLLANAPRQVIKLRLESSYGSLDLRLKP